MSTNDSGRYMVIDQKTGRKFLIEPIGDSHINWGDVNPATKKIEGNYGEKYRGSINIEDSIITEANGFKNIITLKVAENPMDYINKLLDGNE
jgi:hypothetical protein